MPAGCCGGVEHGLMLTSARSPAGRERVKEQSQKRRLWRREAMLWKAVCELLTGSSLGPLPGACGHYMVGVGSKAPCQRQLPLSAAPECSIVLTSVFLLRLFPPPQPSSPPLAPVYLANSYSFFKTHSAILSAMRVPLPLAHLRPFLCLTMKIILAHRS